MTTIEAKQILELYRPGTDDRKDPDVIRALEMARLDPELSRWLEEHRCLQVALREKFQEIAVPAGLKGDILMQSEVLPRIPWWRDQEWLPLAACIVLFIGLCVALEGIWKSSHVPDRFVDFEGRMVRSALREYHMDVLTNDLTQVRHLLAARKAPADFPLPGPLKKLPLMGGGVLRWRNNPVAMVCFDRGDKQMLFLFVMDKSVVKDAPGAAPAVMQIGPLTAMGWSESDRTYVLAGPQETDFLKKYF